MVHHPFRTMLLFENNFSYLSELLPSSKVIWDSGYNIFSLQRRRAREVLRIVYAQGDVDHYLTFRFHLLT